MSECECACVCACACVCVCVCMHACVSECVCVFACACACERESACVWMNVTKLYLLQVLYTSSLGVWRVNKVGVLLTFPGQTAHLSRVCIELSW